MTKAKNADEYIAHQRQAIAQNPECGNSHYNLAVALMGQKKYDEAETVLLAAHPDAFTAGYEELKGDLYVAKGEIAQARVAYDKAINASNGNASRWLILRRREVVGAYLKSRPADACKHRDTRHQRNKNLDPHAHADQ